MVDFQRDELHNSRQCVCSQQDACSALNEWECWESHPSNEIFEQLSSWVEWQQKHKQQSLLQTSVKELLDDQFVDKESRGTLRRTKMC